MMYYGPAGFVKDSELLHAALLVDGCDRSALVQVEGDKCK